MFSFFPNVYLNVFLCCYELHYNLISPRGYSNILCSISCVIMFSYIDECWPIPRVFVVCGTYNRDGKVERGENPVVCSLRYLYLNIYNSHVIRNYVIFTKFQAHVFPIHWKLWINSSLVSRCDNFLIWFRFIFSRILDKLKNLLCASVHWIYFIQLLSFLLLDMKWICDLMNKTEKDFFSNLFDFW